MTKQIHNDKNLQNVVNELETSAVNSHQAQQLNQDHMDNRKQALKNKKGYKENENMYQ
ncbi:hypothetical protein [Marinicrinis lubricantis]|uniref:Uncharacterized protein n=1 Tax=Marinicrinis lubricantis TaxID=2086470 RepID=A0ABW1IKA0_9BACL